LNNNLQKLFIIFLLFLSFSVRVHFFVMMISQLTG